MHSMLRVEPHKRPAAKPLLLDPYVQRFVGRRVDAQGQDLSVADRLPMLGQVRM